MAAAAAALPRRVVISWGRHPAPEVVRLLPPLFCVSGCHLLATDVHAVKVGEGLLSISGGRVLDEGNAAHLFCVVIPWHVHILHRSVFAGLVADVLRTHTVAHVPK